MVFHFLKVPHGQKALLTVATAQDFLAAFVEVLTNMTESKDLLWIHAIPIGNRQKHSSVSKRPRILFLGLRTPCIIILMNTLFWVLGGGAFLSVVLYNSVIAKRNGVKNAFASIDTMLKKRFDLIPNLVATVQEAAKFERGTLEKIVQLRTEGIQAGLSLQRTSEIDRDTTQALRGLFMNVENYPELKSNQNFSQLQNALMDIEDQLAAIRRTYNAAVTIYNNALSMFPSNLFAAVLNYKPEPLFEATAEERGNVDVKKLFAGK